MKIVHLISSLALGGAERLVEDLAVMQARAGSSVMVIGFAKPQEFLGGGDAAEDREARLSSEGISVFYLGAELRRSPVRSGRALRRLVKKFEADIIHSHLLTGNVATLFVVGCPPVCYTHHSSTLKIPPWLFRTISAKVKVFIGVSGSACDLLSRAIKEPVEFVRNGLNLSSYLEIEAARRASSSDEVCVFSAGNLRREKNYVDAIRIFKQAVLIRPDIDAKAKYLIAGVGPEEDALLQLVTTLDLDRNIKLLGAIADIRPFLEKAHIYLSSSSSEGLPLALVEAAAAGLPILCNDVGGCSEVVSNGVNGFLSSPGDIEAQGRRLVELIDNEILRRELGVNGRVAARKFEISSVWRRYEDVYSRTMSL